MNKALSIYALHGFLGLPEDWHGLLPQGHFIDVLQVGKPGKQFGLQEWAKRFNEKVSAECRSGILVGYSLGGRLAMHALAQNPGLWKGAVLISSHPGLETEAEKVQRVQDDEAWAARFMSEEWDPLMQAWNHQAAFTMDHPLMRLEKNYSRTELADLLRYWSLGRQANLTTTLINLPMPILWMAGERDLRYANLALKMGGAHVWIAPNSGHRVPWACKQQFIQRTSNFITLLQEKYEK